MNAIGNMLLGTRRPAIPYYAVGAKYLADTFIATQTLAVNIPAGSTVIVCTGTENSGGGAGLSVADNGASGGNTYSMVLDYAASYPGFGSWASETVSKAATSVTVNATAFEATIVFIIVIVIPFGGTIGAHSLNNNGVTASITTTANNSWVIGLLIYNEDSVHGAWTNTGMGIPILSILTADYYDTVALVLIESVPSSGTPKTCSGTFSGSGGFFGVNIIEVKV